MPPRASKTKRHPNGSLETTFQVHAPPTNPPAPPQPRRSRTSRRRATVEDVEDIDGPPGALPNIVLPMPANHSPHVTFDATPQRNQHQENTVNEDPSPSLSAPPGQSHDVVSDIPAPPLVPLFLPPQTPRNAHRSSPISESSGEHFPSPLSALSASRFGDTPTMHSPLTSRNRHTPRAGPHSPRRRRAIRAPAGNKQEKKARDVRTFYSEEDGMHICLFCKEKHTINPQYLITRYSKKTSTTVQRNHLRDSHVNDWIAGCDRLGIDITAKGAEAAVRNYRRQHGSLDDADPEDLRKRFTPEAFVDAIVDFIVSDDQSINVIESPKLRAIFLMLREGLKDTDIPHRTTIRSRIMEVWDEHLDNLQEIMRKSLGKISFTSDLWSDPNLTPFMAVTAHWIETQTIQTAEGPQHILKLRADLVAFHRVPGRHTGEHIAEAFLHVLDRICITSKIGWITLDNASNNDTFMAKLEEELKARGISFDRVGRRIRCFPHIVNLACKAILAAISTTNFDGMPPNGPETFMDNIMDDPIARLRALIRVIRASSLRRQCFSELAVKQFGIDVQLLRDVDTRWSSTCLMIDRALYCKPVITRFLAQPDFEDLRRYHLFDDDWEALQAFYDILSVPHMFQQRLSAEKTPTLCGAISGFHAIKEVWELYQDEHPETLDIVQAGIDKINEYSTLTSLTPAYTIAMLLNPAVKLSWHSQPSQNGQDIFQAKQLFIKELRPYYNMLQSQRTTTLPSQATAQVPTTPGCAPHTPGRTRTTGGLPRSNTPRNIARLATSSWADKLLELTNNSAAASESSSQQRTFEREVEAYFLDSMQVGTSSVAYWQENQLRYPTLFVAALDYVPIQGSAVPCERVFSSGKETTTMRRNRINPDLMEALQMLKFSLRSGSVLNFTANTSLESEVKELEMMVDEEADECIGGGNSFLQRLLAENER